jgi:hypothetical protein
MGQDRDDAGGAASGGGFDGDDPAARDGAGDQDAVREIRDRLIGGVGCFSRDLQCTVDAIERLSDCVRHQAFF